MPTFRESLLAMSVATQAMMSGLLARMRGGDLTSDSAQELAHTMLVAACGHATGLADLALTCRLTQLTGDVWTPAGLNIEDQTIARLAKAVGTAFTRPPDGTVASLNLLARAAPLEAGQAGFGEAMRRQGVPGWTRVTDPGACARCVKMAAAARLPARVNIWSHPGCSCHQDPVLAGTPVG